MSVAGSIEATRELCADLDNLIELTKESRAPIRALSFIERARADLQAYLDEIERTSSAPRAWSSLGGLRRRNESGETERTGRNGGEAIRDRSQTSIGAAPPRRASGDREISGTDNCSATHGSAVGSVTL
jgi:hypothetical protein